MYHISSNSASSKYKQQQQAQAAAAKVGRIGTIFLPAKFMAKCIWVDKSNE